MTAEEEKRLILLSAVWLLGGGGRKKRILDEVELRGLMEISQADREILNKRKEEKWRNDLAYVRKHLVTDGYLSGAQHDHWQITEEGKAHRVELARQASEQKSFLHLTEVTRQITLPGQSPPQAQDLEAPPVERVPTTISRIVRDTDLANCVKRLHNYECQICQHIIKLADGSRYAEAHHVQPLGQPHNGPDALDNIICLCPNHHAECDLGAILLMRANLRSVVGHTVKQQYLDYHNQKIFHGRRA